MKAKAGQIVIITKNVTGHGFNIGEKVKIKTVNEVDKDYEAHGNKDFWYIVDQDFKIFKEKKPKIKALKNLIAAFR